MLVVGLDGAGFDVVGPLVRDGYLPNLAKLVASGVHGDLESTVHPLTPLAWTSFLSGQNPGKHGIFDFFARVGDSYKFRLVTSAERSGLDFMDILSGAGKRVVSLNVPLTYPPRPINGAMVSGMGTPSLQVEFTHPAGLRKTIIEKCPGYAIAPPYDRDRATIADSILRMAEAHTQGGLLLMGEYDPDVFVMVYGSTDIVQHLYWRDFFEPDAPGSEKEFAELLREVYQVADAGLGAFIERMGGDVPVLVVSDHGAQSLELVVGLNRYLADKGYLQFYPGGKPPSEMSLGKLGRGMTRGTILALQRMLPQNIKENIKRMFPGISSRVTALWHVPDMSAVDFGSTKAFAVGSYGSIYINVKGREPDGVVEAGREYEELRDEIGSVLLEWRGPEGERVVGAVQKREELYHGPYLDRAPDLVVRLMPNCFTRTSFAPEKEKLYEGREHAMFAQKYQSIHSMNGICIASGYPFGGGGGQEGASIEGARIIDIAPVILHAMGMEVPNEMDGRVLEGLFDAEWLSSNPPRISSGPTRSSFTGARKLSEEDEERLKDELQGLGYIQ